VRAGGFFENFLYGLQVAQGGTLPVYYNPINRKSTMVATNYIGTEVATLLTGPAWSEQRVVELGSMVAADKVAQQLGEVPNLDVKAFAVPRAGWAEAFEQFGIPKGHTGPAEMFEAVNAGWMDLGAEDTEHAADVHTRCIRGCTERRQGVSPGRIRHETETARSASDASREALNSSKQRNDGGNNPIRPQVHARTAGSIGAGDRQPVRDLADDEATNDVKRTRRFRISPSSPIGGFFRSAPVVDQRVSRKGLHYRGCSDTDDDFGWFWWRCASSNSRSTIVGTRIVAWK
jgi:hypothetical protein